MTGNPEESLDVDDDDHKNEAEILSKFCFKTN